MLQNEGIDVRRSVAMQRLGRVALWAVRDGRTAKNAAIAVEASVTPRTPAFLLRNMPSTPKSASKR